MAMDHEFTSTTMYVAGNEAVSKCERCDYREAYDGSHRIAVNENNFPYSEAESVRRMLTPCPGS
jgi:hypothetical protein